MSKIDFEYKKLNPFKWFILENFPFLEDSIDALTNYELFCKLGEELNKNIDSINTLGKSTEDITTAFNNLYDYVNNYFNNLDVTEEINNKLDEMAEDGTLSEIVAEYIDPYIDRFKSKSKNNLEYMFTIHTEVNGGFSGLCCDNDNYYYYNNHNSTLYKRSLSNNSLLSSYNITAFGHGNDMEIINNKIYNVNTNDLYINIYDLSSGNITNLNCLVGSGLGNNLCSIAKYDDSHVIVAIHPGTSSSTTKLSDLTFAIVNISNNTFEEITIQSDVDLSATTVIQSMEYSNGNLYCVTSQPTMITQFSEINSTLYKAINIIAYEQNDIIGLPYGEMEGITLLPNTYNGKGTMLLYSQAKNFTNNKTLRFYCFNPDHSLPLTAIPIYQQNELQYEICCVDSNATNYFECGTSKYPFKDLYDGIYALNNSKYIKYKEIQLNDGTYNISNLRNNKAFITMKSSATDVTINGNLSFIDCDVRFIGLDNYYMKINTTGTTCTQSAFRMKNVTLTSTQTSAMNLENSTVIWQRVTLSLAGLVLMNGCIATLHFTNISTSREDGKYFNIDRDNFVGINAITALIPAETVTKGSSVVIRYNNVTFS